MHKLRTYLIFCFLSLAFIVGQFIWHINMPYTLAGFRISTDMENYKFIVTDCFPAGPAHKAGLRVGDTVVRINDIDVHEFTLKYADSFEDSYINYSKLYQFDVPYEMECENGFICRFTIKNDMPFLDRLGCICIDNWTTFVTGLIFILFSIVTSIFAKNIEGSSDFIWFMLAMGPCIVNGYTEAANTLAYTIVGFVSFDIATALSSFAIFRSVGYFFSSRWPSR